MATHTGHTAPPCSTTVLICTMGRSGQLGTEAVRLRLAWSRCWGSRWRHQNCMIGSPSIIILRTRLQRACRITAQLFTPLHAYSKMEAVGVGLGTVSLFFQVYDSSRRLYSGYENLRHFGKDMEILLKRIQLIEFDLDTLMLTKTKDLINPPDLDNSNHPATKQILMHLRIILTHFRNCNKIIATVCGMSYCAAVPNNADAQSYRRSWLGIL